MITIVGTGHVLKRSVNEVRERISKGNYDIVAIELDENRFKILENIDSFHDFEFKNTHFLKFLLNPSLLVQYILSAIQREIGKNLNVFPGSEMKEAISLAREKNLKIFLIDRSDKITMNRLMNIPLKEKIKLLFFGKGMKKLNLDFNIDNLIEEENLNLILKELKKFPNLYNGLIGERDLYMAINLYNIQKNFPDKNIIAIVGAGHKEGIMKNLNKLNNGEKFDLNEILKFTKIPFHRKIENFLFAFLLLFFYFVIKIAIKR